MMVVMVAALYSVAATTTATIMILLLPLVVNNKNRYRVNFWAEIMSEDNTSEIMNVLAMMLSMVGILLKYKSCAWFGVLVAAVSYANVRSNYDGKQIMSTFMLSMSSVVMCYLTNPLPISIYLSQQQSISGGVGGSLDTSN